MQFFHVTFVFLVQLNLSLNKKKISEDEKFNGEIFCPSRSNLIKLERIGEIVVVLVAEGSNILLQCKFCGSKNPVEARTWFMQDISSGSNNAIYFNTSNKVSEIRITETSSQSLIIKNVTNADTGLYLCKEPLDDDLDLSFNYLIDVPLTNVPPVVGNIQEWRNYSETYMLPANKNITHFIYKFGQTNVTFFYEIFSSWQQWSECEVCVKNPHQRRTAQCCVRPVCFNRKNISNEEIQTMGLAGLLLYTSTSLPCRGHLLKFYLSHVADIVNEIPDFVQQQPCIPECPIRGGRKGPKERRSVLLEEGGYLSVMCPGFQGDRHILWKHNNRRLRPYPSNLDKRIVIDHFGILHLQDIVPQMKGKYSCTKGDLIIFELLVSVKITQELFGEELKRHFLYLIGCIVLSYIFFCSILISKFLRRRRLRYKPLLEMDDVSQPLLEETECDDESEDDNVYEE